MCDAGGLSPSAAAAWLKRSKNPGAVHEYKGSDDVWMRLCDDDGIDVV